MVEILDCKKIAEEMKQELKEQRKRVLKRQEKPLFIATFGKEKSNYIYANSLKKLCQEFALPYNIVNIKKDTKIQYFRDSVIDYILCNKPFIILLKPKDVLEKDVKFYIDTTMVYIKQCNDIDCILPNSLGNLVDFSNSNYFKPNTPLAALEILKRQGINLKGKIVTVVGQSDIVGKPLALMLMKEKATVTTCNSDTNILALQTILSNSDIIISCIGKAKGLKIEYLSKNQIIIDVGTNFDENGKLCGDVDINMSEHNNTKITSVPGGVGLITPLMLIKQIIEQSK